MAIGQNLGETNSKLCFQEHSNWFNNIQEYLRCIVQIHEHSRVCIQNPACNIYWEALWG